MNSPPYTRHRLIVGALITGSPFETAAATDRSTDRSTDRPTNAHNLMAVTYILLREVLTTATVSVGETYHKSNSNECVSEKVGAPLLP